jgi:hypothetical protein
MKSQFLSLDLDSPLPIAVIIPPPLKIKSPLSPLERAIALQIAPPEPRDARDTRKPPGHGSKGGG